MKLLFSLFLFPLVLFADNEIIQIKELSQLEKKIATIQEPRFSEAPTTYRDSASLSEELSPILQARIAATNYDRVYIWQQFLDHVIHLQRSLLPMESLAYFYPDLSVNQTRGSACVGLTMDCLFHVPPHINAYIASAKLPAKFEQKFFPFYCHTAVLVKFLNLTNPEDRGYLLLDTAFDITNSLIIKHGSKAFVDMQEKGIWSFEITHLDGQEVILCRTDLEHLDDQSTWMIYRTDRLVNPIGSSAIPMFLADRKPTLLSRNSDGSHIAHLNLDFNRKQILITVHNQRCPPVPFEEFLQKEQYFDDAFASLLFMDAPTLNSYLRSVVDKHALVDTIYSQYQEVLRQERYPQREDCFSSWMTAVRSMIF